MTETKQLTRDEARAKILATRPPESRIVTFNGVDIELRQPTLGDVLSQGERTDRESVLIEMLVKYAYLPGTNEHVFEEGDAAALKEMPFGPDFMAINTAMEAMMKIDPKEQKSA